MLIQRNIIKFLTINTIGRITKKRQIGAINDLKLVPEAKGLIASRYMLYIGPNIRDIGE